jgi:hypothetical protein
MPSDIWVLSKHFALIGEHMHTTARATALLGFLTCVVPCAFAQSTLLQMESRGSNVTVKREIVSGQEVDVATVEWSPNVITTVPLPSWGGRYVDASVWNADKLILIGGGGTRILVIDRAASAVVDTLYARKPSVSPSGRQIAFARHYPARPDEPGEVYLLYDLAKTPDENRLVQSGSEDDRRWASGLPIFPEWNRVNQSYLSTSSPPGYHRLYSPLTWHGDSALFFVDIEDETHSFAVVLNLPALTARRTEIDPRPLLDEPIGTPASAIQVSAIEPIEVTESFSRVRLILAGSAKVKFFELSW